MPAGVFGAIVTVPSAFNVKPAGTLVPVNLTSPGAVPITTGTPFNKSFAVNDGVVPPVPPFIAAVVSATATIAGADKDEEVTQPGLL